LGYAIGAAKPVSVMANTFGTGTLSDSRLSAIIMEIVDLRSAAIIERFNLRFPVFKYKSLATYGHMGREDLDIPWEKLDLIHEIHSN